MKPNSAEKSATTLADLCSKPFGDDKINAVFVASRTESEFRARFAAVLIRVALYAFCSTPQVGKSREDTTSLAARFDSQLVLMEKRIDELEQASGYMMMPKKRVQAKAAFAVLEAVRDLVRAWGELYFANGSKTQQVPHP